MRTRAVWMIRLVAVLALGLAAPASAAPYAPHDLGTLGGQQSIAYDINGGGVVVGHSTISPNGPLHATIWFQGRITDLGTFGGNTSTAYGISNNGLIAGRADTPDGLNYHAFMWDHGVMRDLGMLTGGQYSVAYAVNNGAQVVGESNLPGGQGYEYHAFVWQNGTMTDLTPASARSSARDINGTGQIVGFSSPTTNPGRFHAMLWQGGQATDLGANFAGKSYAMSINEFGRVAGYVDSGTTIRAVMWVNGQMTYLAHWAGGGNSFAYGINNAGQVVGQAINANGVPRAVLWQNGQIIDLGTLGGRAATAQTINGIGQVAGWSSYLAGTTGPLHATLWTN